MKRKIIALISSAAIMMSAFSGFSTHAYAADSYGISVSNGISSSVETASAGDTITLTLPDDYVNHSLVLSYKDTNNQTDIPQNITISDKQCTFTMPDAAVTASCIENNDPSKIIIVGTTSSFYARNDNDLTVAFKVPDTEAGYSYLTDINVPVRTNGWNAQNMTAVMNGENYTVNGGVVSGSGKQIISNADNVLTIKNESAAGVDYYYNQKGFYPVTADHLATLTLTKVKTWTDYREDTFTGSQPDYNIVWKVTNNANDRKGASHTVDAANKLVAITTNDGAAGGDVLYGVTAAIKNVQPNTKYTLTFKEKADIQTRVSHGFYINAMTLATTGSQTNPHSTKDALDLAPNNNNFLHDTVITDDDWHDRTFEYISGSGLPDGTDTLEAKFTFIIRGITGSVQIKDLIITGAAGPEPTPSPTPVPAPTKNPDKDYTPEVHMGDVIDPLNTDDVFQYHFAGGTDDYMKGISETGKKYDAYMWVPKTAAPDTLRGLVAIKMNLVEVPLAYSAKLKKALAKQNFGILFIIDKNDAIPEGYTGDGKNYKNILQGMYTDKDYKGDDLFTASKWKTWDGKDAADIMNDILSGIAKASGYDCVAENTPLITIGHSAASPFGYRSGNWSYDRIIAQIDMKNGMWGDCTDGSNADNDAHGYGMVPGIPSLQLAAQYTEHATGASRDRSVCDARYHIDHQRAVDTNQLVSHIIEWGSGHYDWSNNASDMLTKYIEKAIEYRLNKNADGTDKGFTGGESKYTLTNLTNTGYLMKPFEKDNEAERPAGHYRDTLQGWLSSGKENNGASDEDKKASFWFFDEELANEINTFTNYAIPESPSVNDTKVAGKTHSEFEPFMLMKNPSNSVYANTRYDFNSYISPFTGFNGNMSRYGNNRFVNYEKMENPSGGNGDSNPWLGATNTGNLKGYDTVTADTYYMSKIPSIQVKKPDDTYVEAYDNVGDTAKVPVSTKAELVPLMAPYELVGSELVDISAMTRDGSELANDVAAVTRNTLRFHNNRVYYNAGCKSTNEAGTAQESFAMIYSPEVRDNENNLVSIFKSSGTGMNVPYVDKGKGADQTLDLSKISDVNIKDVTENPKVSVSYTSSDADLQKYTDVFVNYGPARAVRTVNPTDGSYTWEIEILLDEIPDNAKYPIEVGIVASNLGKWEKVSGAAAATSFHIINEGSVNPPVQKTAVTSVVIDNADYTDTLPQSGEITDIKIHRENDDNLDDCTVYAALYKDEKLAGITLAKITEFSENDKTITFTSPLNTGDAQELKVFVWNDDMKSMADKLYIWN